MAQFIAFDESVEIIGFGLQSIFTGIAATIGEGQAIEIFKKYNLYPIDEESWYSQQTCLDILKDLDEFADLVAVGFKVFQPLNSPDIRTVVDALNFLDVGYQTIHRGDDRGGYQFYLISDQLGRLICHNPYPADFDFGVVYSLLKHYPTGNEMRIVWDEKVPNRKQDADTCEFIIEW